MFTLKLDETIIPATEWINVLKPLLDEGHLLRIIPSGLSMYPLIIGGRDFVYLTSVTDKKLKRGDIVLFSRSDNTFILHRIHHIKHDEFYMLGDAQTEIEGPIGLKNIHAVVHAITRKQREIGHNNPLYRFFAEVWLFVRPIRPRLFKAISWLFGYLKKMKKVKN